MADQPFGGPFIPPEEGPRTTTVGEDIDPRSRAERLANGPGPGGYESEAPPGFEDPVPTPPLPYSPEDIGGGGTMPQYLPGSIPPTPQYGAYAPIGEARSRLLGAGPYQVDAATILSPEAEQARSFQAANLPMMQRYAAGQEMPAAIRQMEERGMQRVLGMGATARGVPTAAIQRQMMAGTAEVQRGAQEAAAQSEMAYQQMLGGQAAQMRGQDLDLAAKQAGLDQEATMVENQINSELESRRGALEAQLIGMGLSQVAAREQADQELGRLKEELTYRYWAGKLGATTEVTRAGIEGAGWLTDPQEAVAQLTQVIEMFGGRGAPLPQGYASPNMYFPQTTSGDPQGSGYWVEGVGYKYGGTGHEYDTNNDGYLSQEEINAATGSGAEDVFGPGGAGGVPSGINQKLNVAPIGADSYQLQPPMGGRNELMFRPPGADERRTGWGGTTGGEGPFRTRPIINEPWTTAGEGGEPSWYTKVMQGAEKKLDELGGAQQVLFDLTNAWETAGAGSEYGKVATDILSGTQPQRARAMKSATAMGIQKGLNVMGRVAGEAMMEQQMASKVAQAAPSHAAKRAENLQSLEDFRSRLSGTELEEVEQALEWTKPVQEYTDSAAFKTPIGETTAEATKGSTGAAQAAASYIPTGMAMTDRSPGQKATVQKQVVSDTASGIGGAVGSYFGGPAGGAAGSAVGRASVQPILAMGRQPVPQRPMPYEMVAPGVAPMTAPRIGAPMGQGMTYSGLETKQFVEPLQMRSGVAYSGEGMKTGIQGTDRVADIYRKITPVGFDYKAQAGGERNQVGAIAEQLQGLGVEGLVKQDPNGNKLVDTGKVAMMNMAGTANMQDIQDKHAMAIMEIARRQAAMTGRG